MDVEKVKRYLCLSREATDLAAQLKQVKHDKNELEREVVDEILASGFNGVSAEGRDLELKPVVWVSPDHGREAVTEAFRLAGLEQFIPPTWNDKRLNAFVNEIAHEVFSKAADEGRVADAAEVRAALPEPLGRALKVYLGHELSNTKKPQKA